MPDERYLLGFQAPKLITRYTTNLFKFWLNSVKEIQIFCVGSLKYRILLSVVAKVQQSHHLKKGGENNS